MDLRIHNFPVDGVPSPITSPVRRASINYDIDSGPDSDDSGRDFGVLDVHRAHEKEHMAHSPCLSTMYEQNFMFDTRPPQTPICSQPGTPRTPREPPRAGQMLMLGEREQPAANGQGYRAGGSGDCQLPEFGKVEQVSVNTTLPLECVQTTADEAVSLGGGSDSRRSSRDNSWSDDSPLNTPRRGRDRSPSQCSNDSPLNTPRTQQRADATACLVEALRTQVEALREQLVVRRLELKHERSRRMDVDEENCKLREDLEKCRENLRQSEKLRRDGPNEGEHSDCSSASSDPDGPGLTSPNGQRRMSNQQRRGMPPLNLSGDGPTSPTSASRRFSAPAPIDVSSPAKGGVHHHHHHHHKEPAQSLDKRSSLKEAVTDVVDTAKLKELHQLHDSGALTTDEFEVQKAILFQASTSRRATIKLVATAAGEALGSTLDATASSIVNYLRGTPAQPPPMDSDSEYSENSEDENWTPRTPRKPCEDDWTPRTARKHSEDDWTPRTARKHSEDENSEGTFGM